MKERGWLHDYPCCPNWDCPYFESNERVVKRGVSKTKKKGNVQRYICQYCGKHLSEDSLTMRFNYSWDVVSTVIDLWFKHPKSSLRSIGEEVGVSYQTVKNMLIKTFNYENRGKRGKLE